MMQGESRGQTSEITTAVSAASSGVAPPYYTEPDQKAIDRKRHQEAEITAAHRGAYPERPQMHGPPQTFFTVAQFAEVEPAYTEPALRNLIFKAEPRHSTKGEIRGNGLLECGAIVRCGRKVLIHRERFLEWLVK